MIENVNLIREEISLKLRESGYKLTPQREVTLTTLIEKHAELLTAEEIFMAVKSKNPSIGLATVYRTLDLLDELNIVNKKQFHDGFTRYDLLISLDKTQPYYLVCSKCGNVKEIKEEIFNDVSHQIEVKYHFKIKVQDVTFHGVCQNCQMNEKV